jgi:hypothetical protein
MTKTNCLRPQHTHDIIQFACVKGGRADFYVTFLLQ